MRDPRKRYPALILACERTFAGLSPQLAIVLGKPWTGADSLRGAV
jgi:hypothetical protein